MKQLEFGIKALIYFLVFLDLRGAVFGNKYLASGP